MRSEAIKAFVRTYFGHHLHAMKGDGGFPDLHAEWFELLNNDRMAIAAPRGFAKSTVCSFFYVMYLLLVEKKKVFGVSATGAFAESLLANIKRELEGNELILADFGVQKSDVWRVDELHLRDGGVIRVIGAGSQTRGFRPDVVLVDDLENDAGVASESSRRALKDWFWKALVNVLLPNRQLVMIGTILHPLSLLKEIVSNPPSGWVGAFYQALTDERSIWEEQWPTEVLKQRREEIGVGAFESEFQNNPVPQAWKKFNIDDFRFYEREPSGCFYVTTVDPAIQVNLSSDPDYTVVMTCCMDSESNIYVVRMDRRRMLPDETVSVMFAHYMAYKPAVVGVESIGFQRVLKWDFEKECEKRREYPYVKDITGRNMAKKLKIEALQPFVSKGKIYLKKEGQEAIIAEASSFPHGRHDDCLDALQMQLELLQKGVEGGASLLPANSYGVWWNEHKKRRRLQLRRKR